MSILKLFLVLLAALPTLAQINVGRISGTVVDSSGAVVAGCPVQATNTSTGLTATAQTDGVGVYVFPGLVAGTYDLKVEKQGFRSIAQSGVVLDAASQRTANFTLEVGSMTESVSISAAAQQVQTESGDVGRVIADRQLSQIPLNGRNYAQLLRLIPGTAAMTLDPFALQLSTQGQRINGMRANSIQFMLDGADNLDQGVNINQLVNPNVDAIAEVKILTSSFAAEFGGHMGAMVNVVGRSGTQQFHGTLFEFVRNDAFDARSFFAKKVDPLRFNNFGGTLGGPVFIPKRFNTAKEKLFFFYSEEFKYIRQGATNLGTVPTAEERAGDFRNSSLPAPIDPLNGQPFPNRTVPASRFSKNGPPLMNPLPLPNFGGPGGNYVAAPVAITDPREEMLRIDYNLSPKTQVAYRWTHDSWYIINATWGTALGFAPAQRSRPGYITAATVSHTFSPTMLNYFSFSVSTNSIYAKPLNNGMKRDALGLTFPELWPANRSNLGPDLSISGFSGYSATDRVEQGFAVGIWRDDLSKIVRSHSLKFGVQVLRGRRQQNAKNTDQGNVTFNTSAKLTSKNAIADVLLGNFQNYFEDETDPHYYPRTLTYEFYAQDTWRVNKRLSLEYGVRYSVMPPFISRFGNTSSFLPWLFDPKKAFQVNVSDGSLVPGSGDPYNGIAIWGSGFPSDAKGRIKQVGDTSLSRLFVGLPNGGSETSWGDWGPRLGIAWDVLGNGRTAIRTGFGMFYDHIGTDALAGPASNPPFASRATIYDGNIDNPAGGTARSFPVAVTFWPTHLPTPKVISYNFGVQQQLPGSVILEVNYVGNQGRHLERTLNINQLPVGTLTGANAGVNPSALRPYLGLANISMKDQADNSNYNSLQIGASRRMQRGLSLGVSYTWSKTLDTSGGGSNNTGAPQDSYNARVDYGPSVIDRRHVFNVNYVYEFPAFARTSNALARATLGGWDISGVTSAQTGSPNNVTVPIDAARIGGSSSRATVIGDPNLPGDQRTLGRWFNTEAFLAPEKMTVGQFGNSGRDVLFGPGFISWDVAMVKNFVFTEQRRLQFRAESFNVFNHPNFTGINTTVRFDSAGRPTQNYGSITGAGPGRVLSFGLKLLF